MHYVSAHARKIDEKHTVKVQAHKRGNFFFVMLDKSTGLIGVDTSRKFKRWIQAETRGTTERLGDLYDGIFVYRRGDRIAVLQAIQDIHRCDGQDWVRDVSAYFSDFSANLIATYFHQIGIERAFEVLSSYESMEAEKPAFDAYAKPICQ